jgi:chromosome segregation ATPase
MVMAVSLILQSGCTIVQMRKDNADSQTRIDAKQQELNGLQATQSQLAAESARLNSDLQQRELNARELRTRLDELIAANAAAPASSPQQIADRQDRQRQLQAVREQAEALEQNGDLSDEQKRARLEALRAKTAQLLKLLMVG